MLESFYEVPAGEVARLIRSVIAFNPIRTLDSALLLRSLEVYETHRIDFDDAYLVASAEAAGVTTSSPSTKASTALRPPTGSNPECTVPDPVRIETESTAAVDSGRGKGL